MVRPGFLRHCLPRLRIVAVSALGAALVIATAVPAAALPHPSVAVSQGSMTYPTEGQTGVDTTHAFTWSTVPGAQGYILAVGTTKYGTNLVNSGVLPVLACLPYPLGPRCTPRCSRK